MSPQRHSYRLADRCPERCTTRESVSLGLGRWAGDGLVERAGSSLFVAPRARLLARIDGGSDRAVIAEPFTETAPTTLSS
jgi:hypothetical protein